MTIICRGGSAAPATADSLRDGKHFLRMNGKEVFRHAVRVMAESCERVLAKCDVKSEQVAWFIPHQANSRILEAVASQLNVGLDRFPSNLERYGNTSAASIPLALEEAAGDLAGRIVFFLIVDGQREKVLTRLRGFREGDVGHDAGLAQRGNDGAVSFDLELQDVRKDLRFSMAKATDAGDGILLKVLCRTGEGGFSELTEIPANNPEWQTHTLSLSKWHGQDLTLRFIIDPGATTVSDGYHIGDLTLY